ncbi:MAG: trypsin-like peptidase domain-containing protein [Actinomycetaceae bacterium]|nr:trypsin-like peptidase domain-containing protein [Actinomycetaceae bacterium]
MDDERRDPSQNSSEPVGPSNMNEGAPGQPAGQEGGQAEARNTDVPRAHEPGQAEARNADVPRAQEPGQVEPRNADASRAQEGVTGAGREANRGDWPQDPAGRQVQWQGPVQNPAEANQAPGRQSAGAQAPQNQYPGGQSEQRQSAQNHYPGSQYSRGWQSPNARPQGSPSQGGPSQATPSYARPSQDTRAEGNRPQGDPMPQYYPGYTQVRHEPPKKQQRRGPGWGTLVVAMILTALLSVLGTVGLLRATDIAGLRYQPPQSQQAEQPEGEKTDVVKTEGSATDWEAVADAVRPATVSIQVRAGNSGGTGSGVVWDTDGHIVTNYHVVSAAAGSNDSQITVTMSGGRLFEAKIVGLDSTTDLAVIKLVSPPENLVAANFGDSQQLRVGQDVMAIGSPLGLSDTVTTGVISALDRPVAVKTAVPQEEQDEFDYLFPFIQQEPQSETVITNAIQVDASINPGNSGGPLFDQAGYVIGVNSSIVSMGGEKGNSGSIGLGFAIPVNLVKNVATQLIETGEAQHAQLGVTITSAAVTVDGITRLGAEVVSILPGGAAAGSDIQVGDVIVTIDGNDVVSSSSLTGFVRRYNTGDVVTIGVARGGTLHEVQVELQAR